MKRHYRGKLIEVKKGRVNIQLCAQEKTLLNSLINSWLEEHQKKIIGNPILKRDYTYYQKIYSKLTRKKQCPVCKNWI